MVKTAEAGISGEAAREVCIKGPLAHVQEEAQKSEREQQLEGWEPRGDSGDLPVRRDTGVLVSQSGETSLNTSGLQLRPQKD